MNLWHRTEGSGPSLVLLHGWGMHAGVWEPLMPALRERFAVTRVDLPGHGASGPPAAADLVAWAEAVLAVAPERAHWLGWSLGGLVAQQVAQHAPERVERLFLVASTPCFVQRPDWPCAMASEVFAQFAQDLARDSAGTIRRFLALQVRGGEGARATLRTLQSALAGRPAASREGLEAGLRLLRESDLRGLWPALPPPQVLLGRRDTLVPVVVADALQRLQPRTRIEVVAGSGHAPFLSDPAVFLEWVER
ncbi:MAG: pimeloyl-[acyl-carrier protein] methyl ester esterase [Gammaproteobacteria bacterium]|nr:MAG: pimeloyl-[acyl-carrier protein] methyl ester esterase [Gammaproteobacteria bacterium]